MEVRFARWAQQVDVGLGQAALEVLAIAPVADQCLSGPIAGQGGIGAKDAEQGLPLLAFAPVNANPIGSQPSVHTQMQAQAHK